MLDDFPVSLLQDWSSTHSALLAPSLSLSLSRAKEEKQKENLLASFTHDHTTVWIIRQFTETVDRNNIWVEATLARVVREARVEISGTDARQTVVFIDTVHETFPLQTADGVPVKGI